MALKNNFNPNLAPVTKSGIRLVDSQFYQGSGQSVEKSQTPVINEDALTVDVEGVGTYTLMWTPTESVEVDGSGYVDGDGLVGGLGSGALALATGFLFTEGIIQGLEDIRSMATCEKMQGVLPVQLKHPEAVTTRRRNLVMTSSCGVCGSGEALDKNLLDLNRVPDSMRLDPGKFPFLMKEMRSNQAVFAETGGAHAAAIFSADGRIHAVAEDLGRHNALDKVIGASLLAGDGFIGRGVLLTSRLSLEMVTKAVRAGLEIIAVVSAPTSLAIEVAERFGVTLCGFVRDERATVFTHPHRISKRD